MSLFLTDDRPGDSIAFPRAARDAFATRARAAGSVQLAFLGCPFEWAGRRLLQVQCDAALLADALARRGVDVTATDSRPDVVERARERSRALGFRIDYRVVRAGEFPWPDGTFDDVLCDHLFSRRVELRPILCEAFRVLRPNGRLMFTAINATLRAQLAAVLARNLLLPGLPASLRPPRPVSPRRLRRLLLDTGFEPQRFAGLSLRGVTLDGAPVYRATARMPLAYMGTARRS